MPNYIHCSDGGVSAFAGLWETWGTDETALDSCTIIITDANQPTETIPDRMPVIVEPVDFDDWLKPGLQQPTRLQGLWRPVRPSLLTMHPVTRRVNLAYHDAPGVLWHRCKPGKWMNWADGVIGRANSADQDLSVAKRM